MPYHPGTEPKDALDYFWGDVQVQSWENDQPHYFCRQRNQTWRAHATDFQTTGLLCAPCGIILEIGAQFCGKRRTNLQTI